MSKYYISAIIVAAGQGTRMKSDFNKQYLLLDGKPVLAHTIDVFENCTLIDEIIVVVAENEKEICFDHVIKPYGFKKVKKTVAGGKTRQQSMYNGLKEVSKQTDMVITHDGARPLVSKTILEKSIEETKTHKATIVGIPVKDTIKRIDSKNFITNTPPRDFLWNVQTPQSFCYPLLLKAYKNAFEEGFVGTDDAMLVEKIGHPIKMLTGSNENIKITTPEDLWMAEGIINNRKKNK